MLTCLGRNLRGFGQHFESAVGREVKHIAIFLNAAIDSGRRLHTENGLHISRGGSVEAARQHEYTHPRLDAHAGSKSTARERNGARLVGVGAYGVVHLAQRFLVGFLLVAVAGNVHNLEHAEHRVVAQHGGESFGGLDARNHPQRMAEDVAVAFVGKRIHTFLVSLREKVKEILNVAAVNKFAAIVDTEELAEVERYIFVGILVHKSAEVVGIDVQARKSGIWIMVARVLNIPLGLGALLHNIIPSVYFFLLEIVEQIERRAGETKDFRLLLGKLFHHSLTKFGLRTLVGFINDNEIPRGRENIVILVEVTADKFRASEVLHRGEVDISAFLPTCAAFERDEGIAVGFRAIGVFVGVIEYFAEVLEPARIDHRAVSEDKDAAEVATFLNDLQSRERFAETHLGVPEHLIAFLELAQSLIDSLALFGAELDGRLPDSYLRAFQGFAALLDSGDSSLGSFEVAAEPLVCTVHLIKHFAFDTAAEKHFVNLLVIDGGNFAVAHGDGYFRVEKFVSYSGSLGILVNAGRGGFIERAAVGRQSDVAVVECGFAYFQTVAVCLVGNAEHVYQLGFKV